MLFKRYLANECSEAEEQAFFELLGSKEHAALLKELIEKELQQEVDPGFKTLPRIRAELSLIKQNIIQHMDKPEAAGPVSANRWWLSGAAVLLLCTLALFFTNRAEKEKPQLADIAPGGNKAILTLADGSEILLDTAVTGNLANQAGIQVVKTNKGQLVYTIGKGANVNKGSSALLTNTISTPRGGQYQVNLPDGTRVWLNAASVLKFPLSFANLKERRVTLQGEAYFEVEKDARKPFIVQSDRQLVRVLGTHFNINSYKEDRNTKTTLLEGLVKVSSLQSAEETFLKPGQQARIGSASNTIQVAEVDAEAEIAWKKGQFFFENEPIENIMKQISRWYDVDIIYEDDVAGKTVWGSVTRYAKVSKVLSILALTGEIHFRIEGRRIIVHK